MLAGDKEKMLSENEKLEKQQKITARHQQNGAI